MSGTDAGAGLEQGPRRQRAAPRARPAPSLAGSAHAPRGPTRASGREDRRGDQETQPRNQQGDLSSSPGAQHVGRTTRGPSPHTRASWRTPPERCTAGRRRHSLEMRRGGAGLREVPAMSPNSSVVRVRCNSPRKGHGGGRGWSAVSGYWAGMVHAPVRTGRAGTWPVGGSFL